MPTLGDKAISATWGSRDVLDTTLVNPTLVAEISADRAIDHGGTLRHPLPFQRLRLDVSGRAA
ncbi:hypothetical protein [Streptomyces sp. NPDC048357]|uniref:hypothetical protein n=1 Tax=Streptomyces sp. NPDC048357 TaxID=3154719 RepID=UPI0034254401